MTGGIQHLKSGELQEALENNTLVLVDFYADWCGPCKKIAPILETMAKEYTNVTFYKINVEECGEETNQYKITAMPTFILFKKGVQIGKHLGASVDGIKALLTEN